MKWNRSKVFFLTWCKDFLPSILCSGTMPGNLAQASIDSLRDPPPFWDFSKSIYFFRGWAILDLNSSFWSLWNYLLTVVQRSPYLTGILEKIFGNLALLAKNSVFGGFSKSIYFFVILDMTLIPLESDRIEPNLKSLVQICCLSQPKKFREAFPESTFFQFSALSSTIKRLEKLHETYFIWISSF